MSADESVAVSAVCAEAGRETLSRHVTTLIASSKVAIAELSVRRWPDLPGWWHFRADITRAADCVGGSIAGMANPQKFWFKPLLDPAEIGLQQFVWNFAAGQQVDGAAGQVD